MTQAALALDHEPVHYPESDGKPMAETDEHRDEMSDLIGAFRRFYANRDDVYVSGNLLLYYKEGDPKKRRAPDVFVVLGVENRQRRTYRLWEEEVPPKLVIEVTSRGTKNEDQKEKRALYARLGVDLYFLYDPLAEYLEPPFQGFRRVGNDYQPMVAPQGGPFPCPELGLNLVLDENGRLQIVDCEAGEIVQRLPVALEQTEDRLAQEIEARRNAEETQRQAEAQLRTLQAEVERLRRGDAGDAS